MTTKILDRRAFGGLALSTFAAGLAGRQAQAAAYPDHPMELIVPFSAGGGTDFVARAVGAKCGAILGQNIVVENKAGASTVIGTREVVVAKPDGYTMLEGSVSLSLNPTLQKSLPYDTLKDLIPVSLIARQSFVLVVNSQVKANNLQELLALAKANPGKLNYGTAGVGSGNHLAGLLLANMAGIQFTYIPYTSIAERTSAMINGYLQVSIAPIQEVQTQVSSGQMRMLGIGELQRDPALPNVPTISEAGVPGYSARTWEGILVPAGTPSDIVNQLNAALGEATSDPTVRQQLASVGTEPDHSTPEEFAKFLREEIAKWRDVITKAGISAQ